MTFLTFSFACLSLVLVSVRSSSIIIKSGVAKNQEQAQKENVYDGKVHKGIANFEAEEGFNKDDEKKFVLAEDSGRYGDQSANKKAHLDQNNVNEEKFHQEGGGHQSNLDSKVDHHKGHHKSGFHNSYHKDESGSNSSFFDDGSDAGDQVVRKVSTGSFGDAGQQRQNSGKYDSSQHADDQARHGVYDNAGRYQKDHGNRRKYNRNNEYDNREDIGRRNVGNAYEENGRYAEEKFIDKPHHYPPPLHQPYHPYHEDAYYRSPPPLPRKHITVYEDPRYVHSDSRYRRSDYDDDYIQLDIRGPPERDHVRYYDGRPDYYYN